MTPQARLAIHVLGQALEDAAHGASIHAEDLAPWAELAGVNLRSFGSSPAVGDLLDQREENGLAQMV